MEITVSHMNRDHWPLVRRIYEEGIATGFATLETEAPDWESWDRSHMPVCRLVAELSGGVVGWAALSPVTQRCVYEGVAEVSIYTAESHRNKGVGGKLMESLIRESEENGVWTMQASIFPQNEASLRLLRKAGFREVGVRERIGRMHGEWHDILLLERRSGAI